MSFVWLQRRIDPANWNPPGWRHVFRSGDDRTGLARIEGAFGSPGLTMDPPTPAERVLPPVWETLESLRARWSLPSDLSEFPWELRAAGERPRQEMLVDLRAYLRDGPPPEQLMWTVRAPNQAEGRFTAILTVGKDVVVLPPLDDGSKPKGRILAARVVRPSPPTRPVFWRPLAPLGCERMGVGWNALYVQTYVPLMFVTKLRLRLP